MLRRPASSASSDRPRDFAAAVADGDILRPVFDETGGADGFISLEVSPHLARDTAGTIHEARRLFRAVDLMAQGKEHAAEARALRGRAAIASAKLAYQAWQQSFAGPRWERLRTAGARVQRPLWASTSTKDPAYPDVRYVEPLIGPQTISTMPEETMNAFRDHGRVALSLVQDLDEAQEVIGRLAEIGIDMAEVGTRLVDEGISKFNQPFEELLRAIEAQRQEHRGR